MVAAWLEVLDDQGVDRTGRIFRQVLRGGFVGDELSGHAMREIVKRRCDMAGLNPHEFSAHSLRSGSLPEAGRRGVSLKAAMNLSGHSSVVTALGYMREGEVGTEPVARLLDDQP